MLRDFKFETKLSVTHQTATKKSSIFEVVFSAQTTLQEYYLEPEELANSQPAVNRQPGFCRRDS